MFHCNMFLCELVLIYPTLDIMWCFNFFNFEKLLPTTLLNIVTNWFFLVSPSEILIAIFWNVCYPPCLLANFLYFFKSVLHSGSLANFIFWVTSWIQYDIFLNQLLKPISAFFFLKSSYLVFFPIFLAFPFISSVIFNMSIL